ncbi:hypothetical protein Hanom_Chr08g00722271 [Helianthus anomalus]
MGRVLSNPKFSELFLFKDLEQNYHFYNHNFTINYIKKIDSKRLWVNPTRSTP